jgi:hypothetical protein
MASKTYSIDQVAIAARELREAAGAHEERFTGTQVVELLSDEIRILRERGFTDERITGLFTGFDIDVKKAQIERRSNAPTNIIRRMIWNRIEASHANQDASQGPGARRPRSLREA